MNHLFEKISNRFQTDTYSILDDYKPLEKTDTKVLTQNFEISVKYICQLDDITRILNERRSLNAFKFIRYNSLLNNQFINIFIKHEKIIEIFQRVLLHYSFELKKHSIDECRKLELTVFNHVLSIILNSTNESRNLFCYKFHDYDGTKILSSFIHDENLVEKCSLLKRDISINGKEPSYLRAITSSIFNLSQIADNRRNDFNEIKLVLLKFLNNKSIDNDYRMCAYLTLANLFEDNEIETLPDSKLALNGLVHLLRLASNKITSKQNLNRIRINIEIDGEELVADLCVIECTWCHWHIDEILNGLYRISMNDKIKFEMFETIQEDIKKIIFHGNDSEKVFAMRLLCQLCFDEKVGKKIKEDKKLYDFIKSLAQKNGNKVKTLYFFAKGILWSVDKAKKLDESTVLSKPEVKPDEKRNHIMISYNRDSREICLRLKEKLVEYGYKVWIDVEQIEGSSLDSMAKAVENSFCVLICMTEKYKQSTYCRAEAEYTFIRNVPFIPLILHLNYKPDGWLGIMIGSKVHVNFPKYGFDDSTVKILFQIECLLKKENLNDANIKKLAKNSVEKNENIKNWTHGDVEKWVSKVGIDFEICKILRNFNGEMLNQLNSVKKNSPDYFFSVISRNNTIEIIHVLRFIGEFEKLFE
jgi:hypothetical protein